MALRAVRLRARASRSAVMVMNMGSDPKGLIRVKNEVKASRPKVNSSFMQCSICGNKRKDKGNCLNFGANEPVYKRWYVKCSWLYGICGMGYMVCCLLFVVCCLLFAVCCLWYVGGSFK